MKDTSKLKLQWGDPDSLIPYVNNNKKHPKKQIDKIAAQIAEFGFDQPITVDKDMIIITGHGRREACLKLGLKKVPFIVRDDLSPNQIKAKRIADNKVAESDYDDDKLEMELHFLKDEGFDMSLTGFDDKELKKLLDDELTDDGLDDEPKLPPQKFIISIECSNEVEMAELYEELQGRGLDCAMVT